MIGYFPDIYPDELVYSCLARYSVHSGYRRYIAVIRDLFVREEHNVDVEFLNEFNENALRVITKNISMEDIILKHTMYKYYARFLPSEHKKKAFRSLVAMEKNQHHLPLRNKSGDMVKYLRYCPICAENDRKKYGETYYHTLHQMFGIGVCPIHGCYLENTDVSIIVTQTKKGLVSAEERVPVQTTVKYPVNDLEYEVAKYVWQVVQAEMNFDAISDVGKLFCSKLENTKYVTNRGYQRKMQELFKEYTEYYKCLSGNDFRKIKNFQRIFVGRRRDTYEVCLLAIFLGIEVDELLHMKLPEKTQSQIYDEKILELRKQGLKYVEIAERLNVSYAVVGDICRGKKYHGYNKEQKKSVSSGTVFDWKKIDEDTLPLVKDAIKELYGNEMLCPKKITYNLVESYLKLPNGRIKRSLPECKMEIDKHMESYDHYWARKIIWAVRKLLREGKVINQRKVKDLTFVTKQNIIDSFTCLCEMADAEIVEIVRSIL